MCAGGRNWIKSKYLKFDWENGNRVGITAYSYLYVNKVGKVYTIYIILFTYQSICKPIINFKKYYNFI